MYIHTYMTLHYMTCTYIHGFTFYDMYVHTWLYIAWHVCTYMTLHYMTCTYIPRYMTLHYMTCTYIPRYMTLHYMTCMYIHTWLYIAWHVHTYIHGFTLNDTYIHTYMTLHYITCTYIHEFEAWHDFNEAESDTVSVVHRNRFCESPFRPKTFRKNFYP
jgi:hypothetical protein